MARPKKDGHYINANIKKEIYDMLEEYCDRTGMPKTVVLEHSLMMYLKSDTAAMILSSYNAAGKGRVDE